MDNELSELRQWQEQQKKKPNQVGLVRFVDFQWEVIEKVNGKFRHIGSQRDHGLQVENRVYLANGHYKMVNNRGFRIIKVYNDIPDWASGALKAKYASKMEYFAHASGRTQETGDTAEHGEDQR